MNTEMIFDSALLIGMALSFTLLIRARRIAVGLWSEGPSGRRLCNVNGARQPGEMNRVSRA
jgi:hypothetical protein